MTWWGPNIVAHDLRACDNVFVNLVSILHTNEHVEELYIVAQLVGAGGVMIWEVGQDFHPEDERSLLKVIAASVWPNGRPKPVAGKKAKAGQKEEL